MASLTDLPTYPRTYRVGIFWRLLFLLCAVILGSAGLTEFGVAIRTHTHAAFAWSVLGLSSALLLVVHTFKYSVTLEADRITVRILRTRQFRRSDIEGRFGAGEPNVLRLRGAPGRVLAIPSFLRRDRAFRAWMDALPLLGDPEREQEADVLADSTLASTPEARLHRLKRARRIYCGLFLLAVGLCCVCWYYPQPYPAAVAVVAAFPWLAVIVERIRGLSKFYGTAKRLADLVPFFFILPGLGLITPSPIGVQSGFHLQGWEHAFLLSGLVGACLALIQARCDARWRQPRLALAALVGMSAYAYGVLFGANVLLDHSPAETSKIIVIKKSAGQGLNLRTEPSSWGDPLDEFRVSASLYNAISVGDTLCVRLHPGALRIEWFALDKCG